MVDGGIEHTLEGEKSEIRTQRDASLRAARASCLLFLHTKLSGSCGGTPLCFSPACNLHVPCRGLPAAQRPTSNLVALYYVPFTLPVPPGLQPYFGHLVRTQIQTAPKRRPAGAEQSSAEEPSQTELPVDIPSHLQTTHSSTLPYPSATMVPDSAVIDGLLPASHEHHPGLDHIRRRRQDRGNRPAQRSTDTVHKPGLK